MAAKPRITVRLAPARLHGLAYIAEREGRTPAEVARDMVGALVAEAMTKRGWAEDWQSCYRAWLAEQGAKAGRTESPDQADYDALAAGLAGATRDRLEAANQEWDAPPAAPDRAPMAVRASRRIGQIRRA